MSKKALLTGSFDPPTVGHLDLLLKSAAVFDEVTVCIFRNSEKVCMFSETFRARMLRALVEEAQLDNVTVDVSDGYVADYAKEKEIGYVVRGVRDARDMEYEIAMARYNKKRNPAMETLIWIASSEHVGISSTEVRKTLQNGSIPYRALPKSVALLLEDYIKMGFSST